MLSKSQQDLIDDLVGGCQIDKQGYVIGNGVHRKADTRTVKALYARRLIRRHRDKTWHHTPAGKKVASPKRGKVVEGSGGLDKKSLPRKGPGRPKGSLSKRTFNAREIVARLEAELKRPVDPLEGLLRMAARCEKKDPGLAVECQRAALPYLYPRLSSVEHGGVAGEPIQHEHKVDVRQLSQEKLDQLEEILRSGGSS
jgi:hypothetical protein